MSDPIKFYSSRGAYGCFSNFSRHPVKIYGETWLTSEAAYQSRKFDDENVQRKILKAGSPKEAAMIGRDRSNSMRKNWDNVRLDVMYEVIKAKFTQHEACKQTLLSTGDALLIEDSPVDYFWGCGEDGTGKNMLGKQLMRLRKELMSK